MGYDVFLSYHSKKPVGYWVRAFFAEELRNWLDQQFESRAATVFYDENSIRVGEEIDDRLVKAIATSTVFVPVLSPSYFNQSQYCVWEWTCYRAWRPDAVMPVLYYRREALPPEVRGIKMEDFTSLRAAFSAFKDSAVYGEFQHRVSAFAERLGALIAQVPPPPDDGFPPDFRIPPLPSPDGVPAITQRRMTT